LYVSQNQLARNPRARQSGRGARPGDHRVAEAIIEATDEVDPVTQDMMIDILHDEERHRRLFEGYLREYQAEGLA
jgi:bacterioferritin (cytochrome b1)